MIYSVRGAFKSDFDHRQRLPAGFDTFPKSSDLPQYDLPKSHDAGPLGNRRRCCALSVWGCATRSGSPPADLVLKVKDVAAEARVVAHVLADLLARMRDGGMIATAKGAADLVEGGARHLA